MVAGEQSTKKALGERAPAMKRPASFWVALALACFSAISFLPRIVMSAIADGGPLGVVLGLGLSAVITLVVFGGYSWWCWVLVSRTRKMYPEGFIMFFGLIPQLASGVRNAAGPEGSAGRLGLVMTLVVDGDDVRILRGHALKTAVAFPTERICAVRLGETISNYKSIACVAVEVATDNGIQILPFVPSDHVRWWKVSRANEVADVAEKMQRILGLPIGQPET